MSLENLVDSGIGYAIIESLRKLQVQRNEKCNLM